MCDASNAIRRNNGNSIKKESVAMEKEWKKKNNWKGKNSKNFENTKNK